MNRGIYGLPPGLDYFESEPLPITLNARVELTHSLPAEPTRFAGLLVCVTAQLDWPVDARLPISLPWIQYQSGLGIGLYLLPGIIGVRFMNANIGIHTNAATATTNVITPANWRLIVRAWV